MSEQMDRQASAQGEVMQLERMSWDFLDKNIAEAGLRDQLDAVRAGTNTDPLDVATLSALDCLMTDENGRKPGYDYLVSYTATLQETRAQTKTGFSVDPQTGQWQEQQITDWPAPDGTRGSELLNRVMKLTGAAGLGEATSDLDYDTTDGHRVTYKRYDTGTNIDLIECSMAPNGPDDEGIVTLSIRQKGEPVRTQFE